LKILVKPGKSKNILATITIGGEYYHFWYKNAFPSWEKYCIRHGLGLVVFNKDLISDKHKLWKKATWQKMLISETLRNSSLSVKNVCYLDSDILINYKSPNIFDDYKSDTIGLVSLVKNMPFSIDESRRKISFLRHKYYDDKYPLDSAIFMTLDQLYSYHNLPVQENFACTGLIMFNVNNHSDLMLHWFNKYDKNTQSITDGGDQTHYNYEMLNWGNITWLDYKYQAIWTYEMAIKYPFLYSYGRNKENLIRECIEASLMTNYFLHFAGSWYESEMWKLGGVFESKKKKREIEEYYNYLDVSVTGESKGKINPS
jgi:hypothetical protein